MWFTEPQVLVVVILTTAAFVRGAFGFADALLAMPLLLLLMPTKAAAPLMALVACLIAVVILCRERHAVDVQSASWLTVSSAVGVPIGIWMAGVVDERIARTVLGAAVVSFSVWSLWKPGQLHLKSDRMSPAFGLTAGIFGGAYNIAGPPLVFFAALRRWPPEKFRATMQAFTLFGSSWVIFMHATVGNITRQTLTHLVVATPFIVVATLFGRRLTTKLATDRFIQLIYWLLILLGAGLIASAVLSPHAP